MENDSQALLQLRRFRQELYVSALGHRKDSLFELMEAALCASGPQPLVHLSMVPAFRRRWPSACDGLADGSLDTTRLRRLFVGALPAAPTKERELWVIDGTTWPRPAAVTSPDRTYCLPQHRSSPSSVLWTCPTSPARPSPAYILRLPDATRPAITGG